MKSTSLFYSKSLVAIFSILLFLSLILNYFPHNDLLDAHAHTVMQSGNFDTYLPNIHTAPVYMPPEYVKTIELPGALCPNDVKVNPTTGIAYVANHESGNVSLLKDAALLGTVATGEWPTLVSSAPHSNKSYVTNLHAGVSFFEGTQLTANVFPAPSYPGEPISYGEPYAAAYNPVNGYVYIVHIGAGGYIQVVDGTQTIANIPVLEGWMVDVKVDPITGLVYVANVEHGLMIVIQDTSIIHTFRLGWGPDKLAINEATRYIYAAHTSPNAQYPHNISITNLDTYQVIPLTTASTSRRVGLDKLSNLAYFTNPEENTVTIVQGTTVVGNAPVGQRPWDVAVHPQSGYAFVANLDSQNVTVLRDGQLVTTLGAGSKPISVGIDPLSHYIYVANETSHSYCNDLNQCYKECNTPATVTVYQLPIE
jgi:DNA-binding beta-propeller fold protein YncE